jgi:hypothetical protein
LTDEAKKRIWHKLGPQRKYVMFLAGATARFHAPVAIPVLCELSQRAGGPDAKGEMLLRQQALWGIGILGDNIRNFAKLPIEHRTNILTSLSAEADNPQRSAWARTALRYLEPSTPRPGAVEVDQVLARCAESDDPNTREWVAIALRFWDGDQVEPTLLKLSRDDGRGQLIRLTELD